MLPASAPSKVTEAHLERGAVVYLRQSTVKQVRHNGKSRCVKTFHNYVFPSLVCACGLRLGEALALTIDDVDATATRRISWRRDSTSASFSESSTRIP